MHLAMLEAARDTAEHPLGAPKPQPDALKLHVINKQGGREAICLGAAIFISQESNRRNTDQAIIKNMQDAGSAALHSLRSRISKSPRPRPPTRTSMSIRGLMGP